MVEGRVTFEYNTAQSSFLLRYRSMTDLVWKFPRNDSNETEGPNDGGISHFTSNRLGNVIRESIQNSLDARSDDSKPVRVEIALTALSKEAFGATSLEQSLSAAANSPHNDQPHSRQFKNGRKSLLQNGGIQTLCITDRNTTGADDIPREGNAPSKWESLTKSTGLSVKDQPDAAGSFGLGKHAPFALTDIRTVLYSTAWKDDGKLQLRFQGKTILVSHEDATGVKRRKNRLSRQRLRGRYVTRRCRRNSNWRNLALLFTYRATNLKRVGLTPASRPLSATFSMPLSTADWRLR